MDRTGFGLGFTLAALATCTGASMSGSAGRPVLGIGVASCALIGVGIFLGTTVARWGFLLGVLSWLPVLVAGTLVMVQFAH